MTSFFSAVSQVKSQAYRAGFTTLTLMDSSRLYKPNTSSNDPLHYRPLDLDIWYPSLDKKVPRVSFGNLLRLFEQRANKYQDKKNYKGITEELAVQFAVESGLEPEDGTRLLAIATNSHRNAVPLRKKAPLILYMAGLNGMSFENYKLFELLAENGYVVVSISSIGSYPGDMTNKKVDMMEQVYDAEYAIKVLKEQNNVKADFEKIGVIGYSWGGMSAAVLTSRNTKIKALISLDGSENHQLGENGHDDKNLEEIDGSRLLNEKIKGISYFYLTSEVGPASTPADYSYFTKVQVNKYYLCFPNSRHEDLSCVPSIIMTSGHAADIYNAVLKSSLLFFNEKLKDKEGFVDHYNQLKKLPNIGTAPIKDARPNRITEELRGTVFDGSTGEPLPYVNIGTINNEAGTVTNERGQFEMVLRDGFVNDSLRISIVGYKAQVFKISGLLNQTDGVVIKMVKDIKHLKEVIITNRKFRTKVLGNKTTSKFLSTPFNNQLGAEMGINIPIKKRPTFVDVFNFSIAHNSLRSKVWFRLNIYDIKNGRPSRNILSHNILIPVEARQTGLISVDLKPYDITLTDDVMVSLEWVKNEGTLRRGDGIYLSAGLLSTGTFVKQASQGKMKKHSNLGVGFNLNVRY